MKVSVLTVTYGDRFKFSSRVIEACLADENLYELILVDNASKDKERLTDLILNYPNVKIKYIRLEENTGSAGGFSNGLRYFLSTDADRIILLDDDNLPENNFIKSYLDTLNLFPLDYREDVVLSGRRMFTDVSSFYGNIIPYSPKSLFGYNLFNPTTIFKLAKKHLRKKKPLKQKDFRPLYIHHGLAYGGGFISRKIVEKIGLPLEYFFTYADDVEYGARIRKNGFVIYQLYTPYLLDLDTSNREEGYLSNFSEEVADFRVFYSFRNNTYTSLYVYGANILIMLINTFLIIFILNIIYLIRHGFKKILFNRDLLILKAICLGIKKDFSRFKL